MKHAITGIDHPVIAVRDMAGARRAYERLGFTIPPQGSHQEWGTGNWCIMFEHDYLELRGVVRPERYTHGLDTFLEEREGLIGVAFATVDANETYRLLKDSGLHPSEPRSLTRNFELPEGVVEPRFNLCFWDPEEPPGLMSALVCQHFTPELIRRPDWLVHANGIRRVLSVTAVVEDVGSVLAAYGRVFGEESVRRGDAGATVDVGGGHRVELTEPAGLGAAFPEARFRPEPALPYLAAVTLAVDEPDRTAGYLDSRGVRATRGNEGAVIVAPEDACGVILSFRAAAPPMP